MSEQESAHITAQTTLAPALKGWKIYLEDQDSSPHTVKAFIGDLNILAAYLPPDRTLGSITTNDLNNFLDWMENERKAPCSPKTLARRITSLKAFFGWLHDSGVLLVDPAEKVVQQSVRSPLPEVLTPDEMDAVLEIAKAYGSGPDPDRRYYALVKLLLDTGIKKGECLDLSPNHLHLDAPKPILFVRYDDPDYRYKERKIELTEAWVEAYHDYARQYDLSDRVFPWSPRRLEYLLEDLSDDAGLDKHLSFRMCRWTCAIVDWRAGMKRDKIRQKLGISEVQWREVSQKLRRLDEQLGRRSTSGDSPNGQFQSNP